MDYNSSVENQKDLIQLLGNGRSVQFRPQGYSMYPFILPDRDWVIVRPVDGVKLRRGDIVLYRRPHSILVLHRIWKVKEEVIYLVGDNQTQIEGPLPVQLVYGILTTIIRGSRTFKMTCPFLVLAGQLWLMLRPIRPQLSRIASNVRKRFPW